MRGRFHLLTLVCAALVMPVAGVATPPSVMAAGPGTETVYVDGVTAEINTGAAIIFDPSAALLQLASPIYIVEFPVAAGTTGPITLPSGYRPQHNGSPPSPIPYHDHVLASTPGVGAAQYSAPLRVVAMRYSRAYAYSPTFVPITSAGQVPAAEAAGKLEQINAGAPNPYELWTSTVLIRPVLPEP